MQRIEVVRGSELKEGDSTQGIVREKAFESENVLVSRSRVGAGIVSGWHHHGTRELYGFLVSGRLRLEYGKIGREAAEVGPGDFFHIPAGLVHRDLNPDNEELLVVNILVGRGPPVVNVQSPQASPVDWDAGGVAILILTEDVHESIIRQLHSERQGRTVRRRDIEVAGWNPEDLRNYRTNQRSKH